MIFAVCFWVSAVKEGPSMEDGTERGFVSIAVFC